MKSGTQFFCAQRSSGETIFCRHRQTMLLVIFSRALRFSRAFAVHSAPLVFIINFDEWGGFFDHIPLKWRKCPSPTSGTPTRTPPFCPASPLTACEDSAFLVF